jgi:hypothetical protein
MSHTHVLDPSIDGYALPKVWMINIHHHIPRVLVANATKLPQEFDLLVATVLRVELRLHGNWTAEVDDHLEVFQQ